jgi:putative mycofactocin binding protein MftB
VALRREPFGALSYHYGTRRLNFVRSVELVEVLEALGSHPSAADAMAACGISEERRGHFERALSSLLENDVICARSAVSR